MPGGLTTIHAETSRDVGFTVKYMVERRRVSLSSARLSSGRIVLRVTQVAMRGNSCIHPIDLISNTIAGGENWC